jgi:hypothetical protein
VVAFVGGTEEGVDGAAFGDGGLDGVEFGLEEVDVREAESHILIPIELEEKCLTFVIPLLRP